MEFAPFLNPNNPMFASTLGIGNATPASFGSLAPTMMTTPAAPQPGAPLDIRSPVQQQGVQPQQGGFNQKGFDAALGMLQKAFAPPQQQAQWMKPMSLKPAGFGMLNGY